MRRHANHTKQATVRCSSTLQKQQKLKSSIDLNSSLMRISRTSEVMICRICCFPRYCPFCCSDLPVSMTGYLDAHSQPTWKASQCCFINYNKSGTSDVVYAQECIEFGWHAGGLHLLAKLHIFGDFCMQCQLSDGILRSQILWSWSLESLLKSGSPIAFWVSISSCSSSVVSQSGCTVLQISLPRKKYTKM
jgi:hypothetical protein